MDVTTSQWFLLCKIFPIIRFMVSRKRASSESRKIMLMHMATVRKSIISNAEKHDTFHKYVRDMNFLLFKF